MKCPYCNGDHPDEFKYCPCTGKEIKSQFKACTNESCRDYGKYILPLEARFCAECGSPIKGKDAPEKTLNPGDSEIVVVCSGYGSFIQVGKLVESESFRRTKRIRLSAGKNVISMKNCPELKYGFSFDRYSDNPRLIKKIILDNYDTSSVTDMSGMFFGCSSLKSLDLSGFDTSSVTDMRCLFSGCSSLKSLDLSCFDTSAVTNMMCMFSGCSSLKSLDLSCFDTSSVTNMRAMFSGCSSLSSLDLSSFDTSSVTDMMWMFSGCSSLVSLDLSGFDTSSVTDMRSMFYGCSSLSSLDLSCFDTSSVTNMMCMFDGCSEYIRNKYRYLERR